MQSEPPNPAFAEYVLERLLDERRLSPGEVAGYVAELPAHIESLEARLRILRDAANGSAAPNPAPVATRKRQPKGDQSWRKLNGRYAGLVRQFAPDKRAEYKAMSQKHGKEFTIKRMREALGK